MKVQVMLRIVLMLYFNLIHNCDLESMCFNLAFLFTFNSMVRMLKHEISPHIHIL